MKKGATAKLVTVLFLTIWLISSGSPSKAEAEPQAQKTSKNLIVNGSFEEEDEAGLGVAKGWKPRFMRTWITLDETVKHSGTNSLKFAMRKGTGAVECWKQKVKVQGGKPYRVKFWCKSENFEVEDYWFNYVHFLDGSGKLLKQHYIGTMLKMKGSKDWTEHVSNVTAPAEAVEMEISLGIYQATATLWYDDVSIIPLF